MAKRHTSNLDRRLLDLVPDLAPLVPPASVQDKGVYSPVTGSSFARYLRERQVDALIVTGAETDVCVLATVLGAVDYGFRVVLVPDAMCSSSDSGHDALLTLYRERFTEQIEIAEAESVLSAWPKNVSILSSAPRQSQRRLGRTELFCSYN